ncbi:thioredoxin family protein [Lentiprolixibacter aurantiacus]|uniref:Thioredoxin family protein n=1 Tax=Lentiprolixibacter aurantiacus TaxID=2993939 RepID=A0AAE3MHY4_9FLAO|nr:thioredoxin family protein [Lentiprolixibacter aurantiacus]MCX2717980.1 thioredoxin family protein [Lentiprolixibacter aurantiacus]
MKTTLSMFLALLLVTTLAAQDEVKEIELSNGNSILLGSIPEDALRQASYSNWYSTNYSQYFPDLDRISQFKEELKKYHILVFMGTWCGDSQREVPRFMKILDVAEFPEEQVKLVAVDQRREFYKQSPGGEEWGLNISRVPTFIFLKNGKEVDRIVEYPLNTLELDMEKILLGMQ